MSRYQKGKTNLDFTEARNSEWQWHQLGHMQVCTVLQGPDLQNILRQSYDYLTTMPKLRWTYDGRLIYKTSYEGPEAFLRYDSLAKS